MNKWRDLEYLDGIFVGMLDADEIALLDKAVEEGVAWRSYEGVGGLLGLAKVRLVRRPFVSTGAAP